MNVDTKHLVPASSKSSISLGFFSLVWLIQDQKVTFLHIDVYRRGSLSIGKDKLLGCVVRDQDGNDIVTVWIMGIAYS